MNLKNMPLIEALIGSSSYDLYDAIFDVELSGEQQLFDNSDDETAEIGIEAPPLRSLKSRDSFKPLDLYGGTPRRDRRKRVVSTPQRGVRTPGPSLSPNASPHLRPRDGLFPAPTMVGSLSEGGRPPSFREREQPSPLTRLFSARRPMSIGSDMMNAGQQAMTEDVMTGIRKMEGLLEGIRELPVQKLKDEMKELQVCSGRPLPFLGVVGCLYSLCHVGTTGTHRESTHGPDKGHEERDRTKFKA